MKARAIFAPLLRASSTPLGLLEPRGGWNVSPYVAAITRTNANFAQQRGVARVVSTPTTTVVTLGTPSPPTATSSYSVRQYSSPSSTATHTPADEPAPSQTPDQKHTFYSFFPQSLPLGPPPKGPFSIPARELRQEYIQLQQKLHPDLLRHQPPSENTHTSSDLSRAYTTLLDPLHRAEYILSIQSPQGYDPETAPKPSPELLAEVLEIREEIEECEGNKERVESMMREVEGRCKREEGDVGRELERGEWESAREGVGRWRYWRSMMGRLGELEEEVIWG